MLALFHLKKKALILEKSQLLSQYSQKLKSYFVKLSVLDYLYWLFPLSCFIWGRWGGVEGDNELLNFVFLALPSRQT